eukprot:398436_1
MNAKCASSIKVYRFINNPQNQQRTNTVDDDEDDDNDDIENAQDIVMELNHKRDAQNSILYGELLSTIDPGSSLWKYYIFQKIFLMISLPSLTMVVFNYWLFVYSGVFDND